MILFFILFLVILVIFYFFFIKFYKSKKNNNILNISTSKINGGGIREMQLKYQFLFNNIVLISNLILIKYMQRLYYFLNYIII